MYMYPVLGDLTNMQNWSNLHVHVYVDVHVHFSVYYIHMYMYVTCLGLGCCINVHVVYSHVHCVYCRCHQCTWSQSV